MMGALARSTARTTIEHAIAVTGAFPEADASLTRVQIAVALGWGVDTGTSNTRVIAAKKYGLIEAGAEGGFTLTDLGRRFFEGRATADDVLEAIRCVPVFKTVLDELGGVAGDASQEHVRAIVTEAGMDADRVEETVRTFRKSLAHWKVMSGGGLPATGGSSAETVVLPRPRRRFRIVEGVATKPESTPQASGSTGAPTAGSVELADHPLVRAVLAQAPAVDQPWPQERREAWQAMFLSTLSFIYGE